MRVEAFQKGVPVVHRCTDINASKESPKIARYSREFGVFGAALGLGV